MTIIGCNCGKSKTGLVNRATDQPAIAANAPRSVRSTTTARGGKVVKQGDGRTKVMFFAVPPPEDKASEEMRFATIREARVLAAARSGWRVEARRVPVKV